MFFMCTLFATARQLTVGAWPTKPLAKVKVVTRGSVSQAEIDRHVQDARCVLKHILGDTPTCADEFGLGCDNVSIEVRRLGRYCDDGVAISMSISMVGGVRDRME